MVVSRPVARADDSSLARPSVRDEVDPELISLPAPPNGRRFATMALMAAVVALSVGLAASLRFDLAYFFSPSRVTDLGQVTALEPGALRGNTFVRVAGTPSAAATLRYQRVVTGESYVVAPLAGQRTLYVHMPESMARSGRTEFSGRLVTFGQLGGRMRGVQEYLAGSMEQPASSESFVLLVDESPGSYAWALGLVALCAIFVLIDVFFFVRWFRRAGPGDGETDGAATA